MPTVDKKTYKKMKFWQIQNKNLIMPSPETSKLSEVKSASGGLKEALTASGKECKSWL